MNLKEPQNLGDFIKIVLCILFLGFLLSLL